MKTTELFVEQVLIGIAVLFTGTLLVAPERLHSLNADIGGAALLVGGGYLLGMFFDRFADTLLQDTEQQHRLLRALRASYRDGGAPKTDPFPENRWRARLWFSTEAARGEATYLRSRMRLTRATCTLVPALGVGAALEVGCSSTRVRVVSATVVLAVYGAVFLTKVFQGAPLTAVVLAKGAVSGTTLPRTGELAKHDIRQWYEERIGGYRQLDERPVRSTLEILLRGDIAIAIGLTVLTIVGVVVAFYGERRVATLSIALAMPVMTVFAGWTWWRITDTFFAFLQAHYQYAAPGTPDGPRPSPGPIAGD